MTAAAPTGIVCGMPDKLIQVAIVLGVAIAGGYAVISEADGWEDYVVMGVLLITTYGFAQTVAPKIYARRDRTISREGGPR